MKLSSKTQKLFVDQVNHELGASYAYLGMAVYMDSQDLPGFASWFRAQSAEENTHAMKLYDFLVTCGVKVELTPMPAPKTEFDSPKAVFETGLEMERAVTEQIKAMYRSTMDEGDFPAQPLLHWFLEEQVEEEDSFEAMIVKLEAVASKFNLMLLDQQIGASKA